MNIYVLVFVAGGLFGALITYWVMARRFDQKDVTKSAQSESLTKDPVKAEQIESAHEDLDDLNAQRIAVSTRIQDQRTASRARRASERQVDEEVAHAEAQRLAAEEAARVDVQRLVAEEAARTEVQRLAAEEAARAEAQRLAAEEVAREEAQRLAAEEAARAEVQRLAAEEAERAEVQLLAAEEAARVEAQRLAAEEAARIEAQRLVAEEAARAEAQRVIDEEAERATAVRAAPKNPSDTLVMIVDDSKVGRIKANRLLLNNQFQSQMAEDGRDAVNKIAARMPDIVITDVEMPEMDGFELTKHIRQNPATAHVPVIIISGNNDEYADRAKEAGADFVLGKPYTDSDLMDKVRHFMLSGR